MRRWRILLAGAAIAFPTFVGAGPAQATNENAECRVFTNQLRGLLREAITDPELRREFNREFNQFRNEFCGSLDE